MQVTPGNVVILTTFILPIEEHGYTFPSVLCHSISLISTVFSFSEYSSFALFLDLFLDILFFLMQ